jgi:hypothetical protein
VLYNFFNSVKTKKKSSLSASLTNFAPRRFLERIVTTYETWVHRHKPESKAQSMTWKRPIWPVAKKFRRQPSAGQIMLSLFWGMEVAILFHFTAKGETVVMCYERNWSSRSKTWRCAKLSKEASKKRFLLTKLKKNLRNAGTGALKSRGITLKSDISYVSVHLQ